MRRILSVAFLAALTIAAICSLTPAQHGLSPVQSVMAQQYAPCFQNTSSPENCQSACSGYFTISGSTATVVNTTCANAGSRILLTVDSSIGSQLPSTPTCSTAIVAVAVSARSAGLSFTVTPASTFTTNGCVAFRIDN